MSDSFLMHVARVWLAGKSPVMPGTAGSLAGIALAPFIFMPLPVWLRVAALCLLLWLGTKACGKAEEVLQKKDPQEVVIDEVFGQWLVCLPFAALNFWGYLAAFLLFRFFDITKPWPVSAAENIPGGLGVMLDDGVAGLFAMLSLAGLHWFFV